MMCKFKLNFSCLKNPDLTVYLSAPPDYSKTFHHKLAIFYQHLPFFKDKVFTYLHIAPSLFISPVYNITIEKFAYVPGWGGGGGRVLFISFL